MTAWHALSPKRQTWIVYRIVRQLRPDASLENVHKELSIQANTRIYLRWCRVKLNHLTKNGDLTTDVRDGVTYWYATDKHNRPTTATIRPPLPVPSYSEHPIR